MKKLTVKRCGYFRLRIRQGWESVDMKEAVCIRSSLNRMKFVRKRRKKLCRLKNEKSFYFKN